MAFEMESVVRSRFVHTIHTPLLTPKIAKYCSCTSTINTCRCMLVLDSMEPPPDAFQPTLFNSIFNRTFYF